MSECVSEYERVSDQIKGTNSMILLLPGCIRVGFNDEGWSSEQRIDSRAIL